jgi:hypothetical protein
MAKGSKRLPPALRAHQKTPAQMARMGKGGSKAKPKKSKKK